MRILLSLFTVFVVTSFSFAQAPAKPNVLLIVADDLGYSDLGCYGSEIQTPNLDALAKNGLRFRQFYNTSRCWPSRAAILTGYYAQQVRRDALPGIKSGVQGTRPEWAKLLPDMLRDAGYRNYHSGKWHVDGLPMGNGFDHSYSLEDHDRHFGPKLHFEDGQKLPAGRPEDGYYSSTAIASHAIKCLKDHAEKHADQPFFEFLAFTAPHFPVQAKPEDIAVYAKAYQAGWDAMRLKRYERQTALGLGGQELSPIERNIGPPYPKGAVEAVKKLGPNEIDKPLPWAELNAEQREFQAKKMAIHAAMVDRMDKEIGRVIEQLRAMKQLDNTLILFLSDNGASAEITVRGDGHDVHAECGTGATFLSIGPGWSCLANTPLRRHKTWVHEGGISTPFIVHWPKGLAAKGELRHSTSHVVDIVPTILEVTQAKYTMPHPAPGRSLLHAFAADAQAQRDNLWWFHEGNKAIRVGDWKLVAAKDQPWELFDMKTDRSETKNLAASQPDRVKDMADAWQKQLDAVQKLATLDGKK
jgi:arylsulfatase A-like enzyme